MLAAKSYPSIALWETNIDAQMMWLTKNPETYGVLVSGNMFGDIVSDGFAGLIGGLGFACSANIGREVAVFEPTHGSAPKYAGKDVANPFGAILTAQMMLDHLGHSVAAELIGRAVTGAVRDIKCTRDIGGELGCAAAGDENCASSRFHGLPLRDRFRYGGPPMKQFPRQRNPPI